MTNEETKTREERIEAVLAVISRVRTWRAEGSISPAEFWDTMSVLISRLARLKG